MTADGSPIYWAEKVCDKLLAKFDPKKPTALFLGRYQPFHDGHRKLIEEGLRRVGQVCIAVRDTHGIDEKNLLDFYAVKGQISPRCGSTADEFSWFPCRTSPTCSTAATWATWSNG